MISFLIKTIRQAKCNIAVFPGLFLRPVYQTARRGKSPQSPRFRGRSCDSSPCGKTEVRSQYPLAFSFISLANPTLFSQITNAKRCTRHASFLLYSWWVPSLLMNYTNTSSIIKPAAREDDGLEHVLLQPVAIRQRLDIALHPLPIRLTVWCGRQFYSNLFRIANTTLSSISPLIIFTQINHRRDE